MVINPRTYERRLRNLLGLWTIAFSLMAVVLLLFPQELVVALNTAGHLVAWKGPDLVPPEQRMFSVLAVSLLVVLAVLAYNARMDLRRRLPAVRAILLSKVVTCVCYLAILVFDTKAFPYLVGALADGGIALWTYAYYRHVRYVI
jgi:divalent metal cation (Fe/Co/Zn/Cd) transporter